METISSLVNLFLKQVTQDPLFFVLTSIIFVTAILVVVQSNLVRAGFTLIGCFGAIALLFFALGAELVAVSQILIYAVGITLVVLFAIMLLAGSSDETVQEANAEFSFKQSLVNGAHFLIPFLTFILISYSLIGLSSSLNQVSGIPQSRLQALTQYVSIGREKASIMPSLERIGEVLLSEQVLAFELVSVLLLIAFVSAIVLSKRNA
jgi:NADH:ubiquinone oxidoreductase subunit 6 (subunit J)